jgi:RNA recognition motif. (a.k.a. RRM, RBD, or RNP domain)
MKTESESIGPFAYRVCVPLRNAFGDQSQAEARRVSEIAIYAVACTQPIWGNVYLAFEGFPQQIAALRNLQEEYPMVRAIDPHALHCCVPKRVTIHLIRSHFSQFGDIFCITLHKEKSRKRYAFINFKDRLGAMRALEYSPYHVLEEQLTLKIRPKILASSQPIAPKWFSPARFSDTAKQVVPISTTRKWCCFLS